MKDRVMRRVRSFPLLLGGVSIVGCSMVTDVDRTEIEDDLFKPLDASTALDASPTEDEESDAGDLDAGADGGADAADAGSDDAAQ